MPKQLVVLVGAGASYDCLATGLPYVEREWRPPLTREIFEMRTTFLNVLRKYPGAVASAENIRASIRRGKPLERVIQEGLTSSSETIRRNFIQVALYIQELIHTATSEFGHTHSTKFHALVEIVEQRLGSAFDRVLFISLNYDGFLEKALYDFYSVTFSSFDDYLSRGSWSLVKLHGSANWGFPYIKAPGGTDGIPEDDQFRRYLEALRTDKTEPKPALADIMMVGSSIERSKLKRYHNGHFVYPAIAAPIEGKAEFVCPIAHSQYAEQFVAECSDFLVLGCAILDQDVHGLLSKMANVQRLLVVNGTQQFGLFALEKLRNCNSVFNTFRDNCAFDGGFTSAMDDDHIAKFFDS